MRVEYTHEIFRPSPVEQIPYIQLKLSNDFKPFSYIVVKIFKSKTHVYYFDGKYRLVQKAYHNEFDISRAIRATMILYGLNYSVAQISAIVTTYNSLVNKL